MQLSDALRAFWPVLAAALLFWILGLWWRFYEARAMEQSPKSFEWVKSYRTGGFPFQRKLLGNPKLCIWALLLVLLGAAALCSGWLVNAGVASSGTPGSRFTGSDWLRPLGLCVLGSGAVFCLLTVLFDSPWVSLPGALLFAAASVRSDGTNAVLALSLLLLLLYLRAGRPGFPAELLYLAALLALAPAIAIRPAMLWLLPCFSAVHWYKLLHQLRGRRFSTPKMALAVAASFVVLALTAALTVMLRSGLSSGLFGSALLQLLRDAVHSFAFPGFVGAADLLVDAPLLGFGFWGCCSAWVLAWKRRDARGYFVLAVLTAQLLLWLATWNGAPILGLTLNAACILRDANLARKRWSALGLPLAGIAWYCFVHIAAWAVPLAAALRERLI